MKIIIDQYNQEVAQLESLAELDSLVAERFGLPLRPYSTDLRAAFELAFWTLENPEIEFAHFEVFCSKDAAPEEPFLASFQKDAWDSGQTAAIAICKSALRYLKKIAVNLPNL